MKRRVSVLLLCTVVGFAASAPPAQPSPLSDQFIEQVNQKATTWTAGRNFHPDFPMSAIRRMMGALPNSGKTLPVKTYSAAEKSDLPKNFDSRKKWTHCPSISEIRDQGTCGSCWAISSASVISDRTCIGSNGTSQFRCSGEDVVTCTFFSFGCSGGWTDWAFEQWKDTGFVSGGPYNSSFGCRPYTPKPCEHFIDGPRIKCYYQETPDCIKKCRDGYEKSYTEDLHKAGSAYSLRTMEDIMNDIRNYGPVTAAFSVYEDFTHYKSGVYKYVRGNRLGGHAIRIFGWGEENGVPYWLCANSWNTDWGDKGLFKIFRGSNECGIEEAIVTGRL